MCRNMVSLETNFSHLTKPIKLVFSDNYKNDSCEQRTAKINTFKSRKKTFFFEVLFLRPRILEKIRKAPPFLNFVSFLSFVSLFSSPENETKMIRVSISNAPDISVLYLRFLYLRNTSWQILAKQFLNTHWELRNFRDQIFWRLSKSHPGPGAGQINNHWKAESKARWTSRSTS